VARFSVIVDVHLFLVREGAVCLLRRHNTGYEDGKYHVPAGHMDGGEPVIAALQREAREEIGITIDAEDVKLVHVMHNRSNTERIGFFFEVERWSGSVQNNEPDKCSEVTWRPLADLPPEMVPYARHALDCYRRGEALSLFGWE
jgi:8-oxo-dGTP diphosphatase